MDFPVASVITVLISLLGSGGVSAYVTHRLATTEKARDLRRQKLEKLYLCGVDYHNMMITTVTMTAAYHSGKLGKAFISEYFDNNGATNKEAVNNLTMLCNLYFPELVPYLMEIYKVRDIIGNEGLKNAIHGDPPDKNKGARVLSEFTNVGTTFDEFNRRIFEVGQGINTK